MYELLVVADDMTGAIDTGVQFSRDGFRIYVTSIENMAAAPTEELDVLVVNTETRHLSPGAAAERVREVITDAPAGGARVLYKKTDSTLRGNIGTELEAMLRASQRESVAYLPAYPDAGRTASGGELLVDGIPVAQTDFAGDPLNPVRTSSIPTLLSQQTELPTTLVATDGPVELPLPEGTIVVFDGTDNVDLDRFARLLRDQRKRLVIAGCGGFAMFLGRICDPPPAPSRPGRSISSSRRLVVCGSLNPRSLTQIERAEATGVPVYSLSSLRALTERDEEARGAEAASTLLDEMRARVKERGIVAVRTPPQPGERGDGLSVARAMAHVVRQLVEAIGFDALIVFGGDTLTAVMQAVGVVGLIPIGEVEHGVPVSVTVSEAGQRRPEEAARSLPDGTSTHRLIVSKAGGFGDDDVVAEIEDYLNGLGHD